jgi:hypothetical protein
MTKFQEMRLRAVKFQEIVQAGVLILSKSIVQITIESGSFSFDGDGFYMEKGLSQHREGIKITESQWLSTIERVFEARFPTLLEAQGWIAVETQLPDIDQKTYVMIEYSGKVSVGISHRYIEKVSGGKWFLRVQWAGGESTISAFGSTTKITHWKPLDEFPQP